MMDRYSYLIFSALLLAMFSAKCNKTERTERFAEYLREAKRIREEIHDQTVLQDSLKAAQKRYSLDIDKEISRFYKEPEQWPALLRKLKRE